MLRFVVQLFSLSVLQALISQIVNVARNQLFAIYLIVNETLSFYVHDLVRIGCETESYFTPLYCFTWNGINLPTII